MVYLKGVIAILDKEIHPHDGEPTDSSIIISDEGIFSSPISVGTLISRISEKYEE